MSFNWKKLWEKLVIVYNYLKHSHWINSNIVCVWVELGRFKRNVSQKCLEWVILVVEDDLSNFALNRSTRKMSCLDWLYECTEIQNLETVELYDMAYPRQYKKWYLLHALEGFKTILVGHSNRVMSDHIGIL